MKIMNNKGQFAIGLLIPLAIAILILVVGIGAFLGILFSTKFMLIAIGLTMFVMTMIYLAPAAIAGDLTNKKIGFVAMFLLISVGFIAVAFVGLQGTAIGFQPLSISNVEIKDSGTRILVYASTNGANKLEVDMNPTTLNSMLKNLGYKATKSSVLTAQVVSSQLSFPYTTSPLVTVKTLTKLGSTTRYNIFRSVVSVCKDTYPSTLYAVGLTNLDCYGFINNGEIDAFSSGQTNVNTLVQFCLDDECNIVSPQNNQVSLANNGAIITWQGNLLTNQIITNPSYKVYRLGNNNYLVSASADSLISGAYSSFTSCLDGKVIGTSGGITQTDLNNCNTQYQQSIASAITNQNSAYINSVAGVSSINLNQIGQMVVNLNAPTFIPTFTISLDASRVAIVPLVGIPEITQCVSDTVFTGAGSAAKSLQVKNIGTQDGSFGVSISCNNPNIQATANSQSINAGQTANIGVQVSGSTQTTSTNSGTCTITVSAQNAFTGTGKTDSCTFNVDVKYNSFVSQCNIEGQTSCTPDGKTLLTCHNNVFTSVNCDNGCGFVNGKAQCANQIVPSIPTINESIIHCDNKWLGDTIVTKNSVSYSWYNYLGIGSPTPVTEQYCSHSFISYYIIGGLVVLVIIVGIFTLRNPKKRKKRK